MARDIGGIFESMDAKLGALIMLSLKEKELSLKERILCLSNAGMNNQDIAKLLGISALHVAKEKSVAKSKEIKQDG